MFGRITCLENLFFAWRQFRRGKRSKREAQEFEFRAEDHLFQLHQELTNKTYTHLDYTSFYVSDPKLRHIHKADIRDRVVHHAIHNVLYPIFERHFIHDSYSCRLGKGTHRAVDRLEQFIRKAGDNRRRPVFASKCDIRKFFESIEHQTLLNIIEQNIQDAETMWLIKRVLDSFSKLPGKSLPLGNLTSQLFGNIYLNEFDQFVKHILKERYYIRYCDDFIVLSDNAEKLIELVSKFQEFLRERLGLELHPHKVFIRKYGQGIDFLGYIVLPYHRVMRTRTRRRMLRKNTSKNLPSYMGILDHCNGHIIRKKLAEQVNY